MSSFVPLRVSTTSASFGLRHGNCLLQLSAVDPRLESVYGELDGGARTGGSLKGDCLEICGNVP